MVIMSIVLALFVPTLLVLIHGEASVGALTLANSRVEPALLELQSQVNSASFLYDPVTDKTSYYNATVSKGYALLVYTVSQKGTAECSQWRVYKSTLQDREWISDPTVRPVPVPFRTVTPGVTFANLTSHTSTQRPFQLAGHAPPQSEEVALNFWLSASPRAKEIQFKTVDSVQGVATSKTFSCVPPPA
jgi:hypothetical protein